MQIPFLPYDEDEVKFQLHLKMRPRVDFVRRTLDILDESEKNIERLMERKICEAEKLAKDPDRFMFIASPPPSTLREEYRVALPLNARYAALISAVAGLEWLVRSLHTAHRDDLSEFVQYEKNKKNSAEDAAAARRFEETREIVMQDRRIGQGGVEKALRRLAERADRWEGNNAREFFSNLCAVRNAIVHCGGAVKEFKPPEKLREAIDRLDGFHAVKEEVEVDGEKFLMPLSQDLPEEQIWIERGALNPPIEQALDFIGEIHNAHFG